jgi:hypothetical protein
MRGVDPGEKLPSVDHAGHVASPETNNRSSIDTAIKGTAME